MPTQKIVGTFEPVDFPEFQVQEVIAKIDTGAYTGALHCSSIEEFDSYGGKVLAFVPLGTEDIIRKDNFAIRYVKSSNGKREKRYFITTKIVVKSKSYNITLSLANRSEMKWPVLIGRRFLKKNNFIVDPNHSNLYGEQAKKDQ